MRRWFFFVAGIALAACGARGVDLPQAGSSWPGPPVPVSSAQPRLVLTDDGDDTLAIVSTESKPALYGYAPVGDNPVELEAPHRLAASPDGQTLYVNLSNYLPGAGSGPRGGPRGLGNLPGSLLKLRARDYSKIAEAPLDRASDDVVLSRDGRTAYVSHYDLLRLQDQLQNGVPEAEGWSSIAVVDTASMAEPKRYPICATAHGEALSSDDKTLYVACSLSDELGILDLATHAARRVKVGAGAGSVGQPNYFPYAVSVSPSDGSVWISCNGGAGPSGWAGMRVYDPNKEAMDDARKVQFQGLAMYGSWLPDGKTLAVPHQGDDKISLLDTTTSKEVAAIGLPDTACLRASTLRVGEGGTIGWLVCEGDHVQRRGTLVTLNLPARAITGFVEVGLYPDAVVVLPPAM